DGTGNWLCVLALQRCRPGAARAIGWQQPDDTCQSQGEAEGQDKDEPERKERRSAWQRLSTAGYLRGPAKRDQPCMRRPPGETNSQGARGSLAIARSALCCLRLLPEEIGCLKAALISRPAAARLARICGVG